MLRKELEDSVRMYAFTDELTCLPNRLSYRDQVISAIKRGESFAVLRIDLDRFDAVNVSLGMAQGDMLLRNVAKRLTLNLRDGDVLARLGEDEYDLLVRNVGSLEADKIANDILFALESPFELGGQEVYVSASIGLSIFPQHGSDREQLLRHAGIALRKAKALGGGCCLQYDDSMEPGCNRLAEERELRQALLKGELVVYYQPQFSVFGGEIIGAEALVRWQHPRRGLVPPAEFIPLAEDTGLILPLSEYVLLEACRQNKWWQDAGYGCFRVAVNLTARQILRRNLVQLVEQVLKETGLEAKYLELEIPENIVMQHAGQAAPLLAELRAMGVHIALDDFGTGYSSLSSLRNLPIDTLKIDRSFVFDMTSNPYDAAITAAAVALAKVRGLVVIAEGVETVEQEEFLRTLSCNALQGYLYSRPLPPQQLEQGVLLKRA